MAQPQAAVTDFTKLLKAGLVQECKARGITSGGNKGDLVKRLEAYEAGRAAVAGGSGSGAAGSSSHSLASASKRVKKVKQVAAPSLWAIMAEPEISEAAFQCLRLLDTAASGEVSVWESPSSQVVDTREEEMGHARMLVQIMVDARRALGPMTGKTPAQGHQLLQKQIADRLSADVKQSPCGAYLLRALHIVLATDTTVTTTLPTGAVQTDLQVLLVGITDWLYIWTLTFPPPANRLFPVDFDTAERATMREFAKKYYISKYGEDTDPDTLTDAMIATDVQHILDDTEFPPIPSARVPSVVQALYKDKLASERKKKKSNTTKAAKKKALEDEAAQAAQGPIEQEQDETVLYLSSQEVGILGSDALEPDDNTIVPQDNNAGSASVADPVKEAMRGTKRGREETAGDEEEERERDERMYAERREMLYPEEQDTTGAAKGKGVVR